MESVSDYPNDSNFNRNTCYNYTVKGVLVNSNQLWCSASEGKFIFLLSSLWKSVESIENYCQTILIPDQYEFLFEGSLFGLTAPVA